MYRHILIHIVKTVENLNALLSIPNEGVVKKKVFKFLLLKS
jgi:hypothetical protein